MPDTFLSKLIVLFITELILRWKYVFFSSNDMMPPTTKSNVFYFLEDKYNQFLLHVMPNTFLSFIQKIALYRFYMKKIHTLFIKNNKYIISIKLVHIIQSLLTVFSWYWLFGQYVMPDTLLSKMRKIWQNTVNLHRKYPFYQ